MRKLEPMPHETFTLQEIIERLELPDSPNLNFKAANVNGVQVDACIQTSHLLLEELLKVPGFAETKWRYIRTTSEWIPLFKYVDGKPISDFVDMEEYIDPYLGYDEQPSIWALPKGHPREQYYQRVMRQMDDFEYPEIVVRHTGQRA